MSKHSSDYTIRVTPWRFLFLFTPVDCKTHRMLQAMNVSYITFFFFFFFFFCAYRISPLTESPAVVLIGHIVVDFARLNLNRFTHREIDNQMVYCLHYCVETIFDVNCDMLRFKMRAFDEIIEEKNLQMRDNY